jgi:hypothetical protein
MKSKAELLYDLGTMGSLFFRNESDEQIWTLYVIKEEQDDETDKFTTKINDQNLMVETKMN